MSDKTKRRESKRKLVARTMDRQIDKMIKVSTEHKVPETKIDRKIENMLNYFIVKSRLKSYDNIIFKLMNHG
jgi:hydroxymethylglutaryl-CoA reductase